MPARSRGAPSLPRSILGQRSERANPSSSPRMGCSLGKKTTAQVQEPRQAENPTLLQQAPQEQKAEGVEQSTEQSQAEQLPKEGEQVAEEVVLETEEGAVQSVVCCGFCS
mmetsp:Transcript_68247/g.195800  ORF Transcript_68247/g.195800 Transcript_68247/m.195800 type:complete len:110 (-) Transcript_68247:270-599(-)